jgi:hypothetical protein
MGGTSFVLGGYLYAGGAGTEFSSVERYNVGTDTWTEFADMLEDRSYACAVTIGSMRLPEEQDLFDSFITQASRWKP